MIDLKELLDERSANAPGFDHLRLASVQRRVTVRRRRRIIATSLTAVLAVLFGGYLLSPALHTKKTSPPATSSPSPAAGNPDYANGQHRVAWTEVPVSAGKLELTWTPEIWRLDIQIRCTDAPEATISIHLNESILDPGGICNMTFASGQSSLEPKGVRLGQPTTLTVTVLDGATPNGVLKAAIWVDVPWADYPFPARPAELKPLILLESCQRGTHLTVLRSDPANPTKPMSISLPAARYLNLVYQNTTPGHLRYGISGQEKTMTTWDYRAPTITGNSLEPGDPTAPTIFTVTPEGVTGPWQIAIIPAAEKSYCFVGENGPQAFHGGT